MKVRHMFAFAALLFPLSAVAQLAPGNAPGTVLPGASATQSSDGFSASLVITADPDWQRKWESPPDVAPRFELATEVKEGGSLYILSFLSNPMLDAQGMAQVRCDLRISKPDGSLSGDERDLPCFVPPMETDPKLVYLSTVGVKFTAEAGDPKGTWTVAINVRDTLRNVTIPLQSSFEMR